MGLVSTDYRRNGFLLSHIVTFAGEVCSRERQAHRAFLEAHL